LTEELNSKVINIVDANEQISFLKEENEEL
jgi:hypothetical protein